MSDFLANMYITTVKVITQPPTKYVQKSMVIFVGYCTYRRQVLSGKHVCIAVLAWRIEGGPTFVRMRTNGVGFLLSWG